MGRALGFDVRERGFGELVTEFQHNTREQLEEYVGIRSSCQLTGLSRATLYRKKVVGALRPQGPSKSDLAPLDQAAEEEVR